MNRVLALIAASISLISLPARAVEVSSNAAQAALAVVNGTNLAQIVIDSNEEAVVGLSANMFADDVKRVSGKRLQVGNQIKRSQGLIIAGTLGNSRLIDQLVAAGKLKKVDDIRGKWEATLSQIVENPFPGVARALVIVGSDRRGTAYGFTQLSEKIGVSPWYWWADVASNPRRALFLSSAAPELELPAVKYRGIFINDEDWGMHEWASKTFEKSVGGIGPRTYEKVFELMLRLRLNYIWPAMHEVSKEFHSIPENIELADRYGIVAGASHCEPMLYNNVHWNQQARGPWNYALNRDAINNEWRRQAQDRANTEAIWTLGIRGIHDQGMQEPPRALGDKITVMETVIRDQRSILNQTVSKRWGSIAQVFVPYKEVLPIYDAGLAVPEDVTIMWVDDNFGYVRRLSSPVERNRSGGAGLYWHLSYYGGPHSYLWISTTAPALMWEEFRKAWQNDARAIWIINVGDIKPMEIGMDFFARMAWAPERFGPTSQVDFLGSFLRKNFRKEVEPELLNLLMQFYRLGTVRKPELMNREWALSLPEDLANELRRDYKTLLANESAIAAQMTASERAAYFEMIGFPAQVLGATGGIFMADRAVQLNSGNPNDSKEISRLRQRIDTVVHEFNYDVAGAKWKHMMPGMVTNPKITEWNSQVRWPWGENDGKSFVASREPGANRIWRDAAAADSNDPSGPARWVSVPGLGHTGRAVVLEPASLDSSWSLEDRTSPSLSFSFNTTTENENEIQIDFMPTFRTYPGKRLRISVTVDNGEPVAVEVPGSDGTENEHGPIRRDGVQNNYVRAHVPVKALPKGPHALTIRALDPGVVIDRLSIF